MATPFLDGEEIPAEFRNLSDKEPISVPQTNITEPVIVEQKTVELDAPKKEKFSKKKKDEPVEVVVEKERIPEDEILCVANVSQETPYHVTREGKLFVFNPPNFLCHLPKKLAELFENTKHTVRIYKGK